MNQILPHHTAVAMLINGLYPRIRTSPISAVAQILADEWPDQTQPVIDCQCSTCRAVRPAICDACEGKAIKGEVERDEKTGYSFVEWCPACKGTGKKPEPEYGGWHLCPKCGGVNTQPARGDCDQPHGSSTPPVKSLEDVYNDNYQIPESEKGFSYSLEVAHKKALQAVSDFTIRRLRGVA